MFNITQEHYIKNQSTVKEYVQSLLNSQRTSLPNFDEVYLTINKLLFQNTTAEFSSDEPAQKPGAYRSILVGDDETKMICPHEDDVKPLFEKLTKRTSSLIKRNPRKTLETLMWSATYTSIIHPTADGTKRTLAHTLFAYASLLTKEVSLPYAYEESFISTDIQELKKYEYERVVLNNQVTFASTQITYDTITLFLKNLGKAIDTDVAKTRPSRISNHPFARNSLFILYHTDKLKFRKENEKKFRS